METTTGNGKMFHLAQVHIQQKQVPTFCFCSKNGSIRSELLTKIDRRCIINMSQLYLHHRIEPKEVQPWESGLWDIIIIHRELIRIAELMSCILNEKSS